MVNTIKSETVGIKSQNDIVIVRQVTRTYCSDIKLGLVDQTKIITAASELARNTLIYGLGGDAHFEVISDGVKTGVRVIFKDDGPGIANIELALTDHYTTGNGMGLGLGGSKRLVDEFSIESAPGKGTKISIVKWK